jgi:hypothetical protein
MNDKIGNIAKWKSKILNWAEQDEDGQRHLERWQGMFRGYLKEVALALEKKVFFIHLSMWVCLLVHIS